MFSVTAKILWFLDTLHFNISALDQHPILKAQWKPNLEWSCTMAIMQLSDPVILSGIVESEKYSTIPVWAKVGFDLCDYCAASFMAQNDAESFLSHNFLKFAPVKICHKCMIYETHSLMKFAVQSVMLRSLDGMRSACIDYWGGMFADVHDGPWCPFKHSK